MTARPACGVDDGDGRLSELSADARRIRSLLRRARRRRIGHRARLRQGAILRRLPADRGDGAPRPRHAALRADEAGRPRSIRAPAMPPYAVVQLRQDNLAGDHYSLVGFQTQIKWGDQARVLRLIPGLEQAEFVRFGMVHRNTYVNGPDVLSRDVAGPAAADVVVRAGRCPASKATWNRPRRGVARRAERGGAGQRRAGLRRAAHDGDRRARVLRRRTPTRGTTSRRTSRSGSCRRCDRPPRRQDGAASSRCRAACARRSGRVDDRARAGRTGSVADRPLPKRTQT